MGKLNQLRQEAITKLRQSSEVNSEYCLVGKTKVTNTEKNNLLEELESNKQRFTLPMALYFGSPFWRKLIREANRQLLATQEFCR